MIAKAHKSARKAKAAKRQAKDKAEKFELARENVALRALIYILIENLQNVTGSNGVVIPDEEFHKLREGMKYRKQRLVEPPGFRFSVERPKKKPVIQPSRRIILPK